VPLLPVYLKFTSRSVDLFGTDSLGTASVGDDLASVVDV